MPLRRVLCGRGATFGPRLLSILPSTSWGVPWRGLSDGTGTTGDNGPVSTMPSYNVRPGVRVSRPSAAGRQMLGPKRMRDSFQELLLPFRQRPDLLESYASIHGGLRFGKLMEDLDSLAAAVAYAHCDGADLTLVTAAVDRIDLLVSFDDRVCDVRMRGMVTFVGRSSMEVTISVEVAEGAVNEWDLAALAKFVFVARTRDGSQAVAVNRLLVRTEREKDLYTMGQDRHQYRLRRNERSLFRQPPTEEESRLLHSLLIRGPDTGPNSKPSPGTLVPMRATEMTSIRVCHPQERNIHNLIFGGYLMREAFELAYSTTAVFVRGREITVRTVEDISFVHPVAIGSLLHFTARIVYTDLDPRRPTNQRLHVEVVADVIDPGAGSRVTTNTFHYTFEMRLEADETPHSSSPPPSPPCQVIPESYTEAMRYLEGKRRVNFGDRQPEPPLEQPKPDPSPSGRGEKLHGSK